MIASPPRAEADKVVSALEKEAQNLSFALTPKAVGKRLRERLVELVGPDRAVAYVINAESDDGLNVRFEVARLGPRFLARVIGDRTGATLQLASETTTAGGWRISLAVAGTVPFEKPAGARVQGSFSVVISR